MPAARPGGDLAHPPAAPEAAIEERRPGPARRPPPEEGRLRLIRRSFPEDPELGTAVSRTILERVAAGELPPTIRIHRPADEVAFGRQDVASPGYERAVEATRAAGFAPVERLAGGRAALFHQGTLAIARAYPDPQPPKRTYARFEEIAGLVAEALRELGVDARVGEVPGEYCPGAYSVNARGASKLAGIGQRMIRGGAHVGGVVVVSDAELVRRVLVPVYEALELDWDPATAGSVADELAAFGTSGSVGSGVSLLDEAEGALLAALAERYELEEAEIDAETLDRAMERLRASA